MSAATSTPTRRRRVTPTTTTTTTTKKKKKKQQVVDPPTQPSVSAPTFAPDLSPLANVVLLVLYWERHRATPVTVEEVAQRLDVAFRVAQEAFDEIVRADYARACAK